MRGWVGPPQSPALMPQSWPTQCAWLLRTCFSSGLMAGSAAAMLEYNGNTIMSKNCMQGIRTRGYVGLRPTAFHPCSEAANFVITSKGFARGHIPLWDIMQYILVNHSVTGTTHFSMSGTKY